MAQDTLETVAGKINALSEKIGKATGDLRNYRATRDALIVEAHGRVVDGWEAWVEKNLTITYRAAYKIIAKLSPPKEQYKSAEPVQQTSLVEPLSATREVTDYVAAPKPPAEPPSIEERAKPLMVAWFDAPEDVRAYFMNYAGLQVKPTPKPMPARPKPVPVDPRITNAVDHYLALGDKKAWALQRMNDQPPYPELVTTGPHIDFMRAFWGCPLVKQKVILDAIKIADERNKP